MPRALKIALLVVGLLIVAAGIGFVIWGSNPIPPMPEAKAALISDALVTVDAGRWLTFTPTGAQPTTGLIFYPGGRVDPRAYAPAARQIAAQGFLVVIVPMPLNLAVFNPQAAADVIAVHPEIQAWAVGGHSLGGAMAANFAVRSPGAISGLALWAAYPAEGDDLSGSDLSVVSIFGTQDGLATPAKIEAARPLLPAAATWVAIQGGNHAQFGWYGDQRGDLPAQISRQEQQDQVVQATVALLEALR